MVVDMGTVIGPVIAAATGAFNGADKISKICSNKWKEVYKSHVDYRRAVQQKVTMYKNSMNSRCINCKTSLRLLEGKLKESRSITQKWDKKNSMLKRMRSQDFIRELDRSENTIAHHLDLFRACTCQDGMRQKEKKGNSAVAQKRNHGMPPKRKAGNDAVPQKRHHAMRQTRKEGNHRNHGMPPKRKAGNDAVPQKRHHAMRQTRKEGNHTMPQKMNHGMPQTKVKKRNPAMRQKGKEFE